MAAKRSEKLQRGLVDFHRASYVFYIFKEVNYNESFCITQNEW